MRENFVNTIQTHWLSPILTTLRRFWTAVATSKAAWRFASGRISKGLVAALPRYVQANQADGCP